MAAENIAPEMEKALRGKGLRLTPQRRAVIREVLSAGGHFDADDLAARLRARGTSRATVYRTLPLLVDCGLIRRSYRDGAKECYELDLGVVHHDHLMCVRCGAVIEFRDERIEAIQESACRKRRFTPLDHRLVVRGLCAKCAGSARRGRS